MSDNTFLGVRGNPKKDITPEQKEFLLANYEDMRLQDMADHFDVSESKVCRWLQELKLKKTPVKVKKTVETGFFVHDKSMF